METLPTSENTPPIDKITNTVKSYTIYLKENYFYQSLILIIVGLFFISLSVTLRIVSPLYLLLIIGILVFRHFYKQLGHIILLQFAKNNGFAYQKKGILSQIETPFLKIGRDQRIEDIVSGQFKDLPFCLFNYNSILGSGSEEKRIGFTVCRIQHQVKLPRIFLNAKHPSFNQVILRKDQVEIQMEGDFHKYFRLYVTKEYEIEALQIFTPDVMAKLIDKSKRFSLEFMNDHVYIYSNSPVVQKNELDAIILLAQMLIEELAPTLARLKK